MATDNTTFKSAFPDNYDPLGSGTSENTGASLSQAEVKKSMDGIMSFMGNKTASAVPNSLTSQPAVSEKLDTLSMPHVGEKVVELTQSSESHTATPQTAVNEEILPIDERFEEYLREDTIYRSMLKTTNPDKIRLQLSFRYTILMFAIFLVVTWIVNNRVIMFGFSEFNWLARIRDGLFGFIAGLFSLTIWFGSEVWFRSVFFRMLLRTLGIFFFVAVLFALYFPIW